MWKLGILYCLIGINGPCGYSLRMKVKFPGIMENEDAI